MIDVIMLSWAKDRSHYSMTQKAIDSILFSGGEFNIIVVETSKETYKNCLTINPNERFRFNDFIKYGYQYAKNEYVLFVNNDILAKGNFSASLIKGLEIYDSVSPACPRIHRHLKEEYNEGYTVWDDAHFCGWAFMMKRELIERIGIDVFFPGFCEGWYSDNIVTDVLQAYGLKHALVKSAKIEHYGQRTLNILSRDERKHYMENQYPEYERWKNELKCQVQQ